MSGWEGDFCAEGRDALGSAEFLENKYVREGSVSARLSARLLYGRQRGSTGMPYEVRNSWGGSMRGSAA